MALLRVDVDELHGLGRALGEASTAISGIDMATGAHNLAASFPGSGFVDVLGQAGQFVDGAYQRVAARMTQVAQLGEQSCANYSATDTGFAQSMHALDVHR
jgi:hypothetical protein